MSPTPWPPPFDTVPRPLLERAREALAKARGKGRDAVWESSHTAGGAAVFAVGATPAGSSSGQYNGEGTGQ
ncbi:hypothetical protein GCM10022402_19230 [Salinactinospora qingdaonensis]|uniref:Uncharacterized protein n=1 Tax=Salinactinospora qingdaonensis TaxID=702744 RepID=A0ABP7FHJ9_9ACTN